MYAVRDGFSYHPTVISNTAAFLAWRTADHSYVIDHDEIDLRPVFSTYDLVRRRTPDLSGRSVILVGNANFDASSVPKTTPVTPNAIESATAVGNQGVEPLKGTHDEIHAIYDMLREHGWNPLPPLEGNFASKSAVMMVHTPGVLHIATHGMFFSNTAASGVDPIGLEISFSISALLFAGANRTLRQEPPQESGDDGILTAFEVAGMHLQGTELVVLSACDTGLGDRAVSGEELGLRRAFRIAGADSVLTSMWKVDDPSTALLMDKFYDYWLNGKAG